METGQDADGRDSANDLMFRRVALGEVEDVQAGKAYLILERWVLLGLLEEEAGLRIQGAGVAGGGVLRWLDEIEVGSAVAGAWGRRLLAGAVAVPEPGGARGCRGSLWVHEGRVDGIRTVRGPVGWRDGPCSARYG